MAGIFHRSRGGTRGGQAEFSWSDVKVDKYRENYLGHSVMAPVGRWQKNRDLSWYAKKGETQSEAERRREEELRKERELMQQREEDLMFQALGLAPPERKVVMGNVSQEEFINAIGKGANKDEEPELSLGEKADRVSGLGFKGEYIGRQDRKLLDKGIKMFEGPGSQAASNEQLHMQRPATQLAGPTSSAEQLTPALSLPADESHAADMARLHWEEAEVLKTKTKKKKKKHGKDDSSRNESKTKKKHKKKEEKRREEDHKSSRRRHDSSSSGDDDDTAETNRHNDRGRSRRLSATPDRTVQSRSPSPRRRRDESRSHRDTQRHESGTPRRSEDDRNSYRNSKGRAPRAWDRSPARRSRSPVYRRRRSRSPVARASGRARQRSPSPETRAARRHDSTSP